MTFHPNSVLLLPGYAEHVHAGEEVRSRIVWEPLKTVQDYLFPFIVTSNIQLTYYIDISIRLNFLQYKVYIFFVSSILHGKSTETHGICALK